MHGLPQKHKHVLSLAFFLRTPVGFEVSTLEPVTYHSYTCMGDDGHTGILYALSDEKTQTLILNCGAVTPKMHGLAQKQKHVLSRDFFSRKPFGLEVSTL